MKLRTATNENPQKFALAWTLIALIVIPLLVAASYGLMSIPVEFWPYYFMTICYASLIAVVVAIAGGIIIFGIPGICWIVKLFHWAFVYAIWADKKEPRFPPEWKVKQFWIDLAPTLIVMAIISILGTCVVGLMSTGGPAAICVAMMMVIVGIIVAGHIIVAEI